MLFEPIFAHAATQGHLVAIIDDTGPHTFAQLAAATGAIGVYLSGQTDRPHVGLLLPPGFGFVVSFYGTLLAGKSVVPINYLLSDAEIAHIIADSGIDTVITIPPLAGRLKDTPLKLIDLTKFPPPLEATVTRQLPSPDADDLAVLLYTSGTSGLPKGVMLTYGNLQSDTDASIAHANLQSRHTFLGILPLFHAFGMTAMMLAPIQLGALVIYIARFSPLAALNAIRQHQVSIIFGVPSMFAALLRLDSATPADFASTYALIAGGEPLRPTLRLAFEKKLGTTILEGYGMTETSPVISLNTPADHRPGSVGRTLPGVTVRITDDDGNVLPTGQEGEVYLKGPMIMAGYYHLPEETAAVLTGDGFLKTGDLGKVDSDGYLYITGRKKDLIKVAGEKVIPREVEDVLALHPAVAEVAVVGRISPTRGEMVVAFVVLHKDATVTPEDLRIHCHTRALPPFKIPRQVHLVQDLPRSPTGKILKRLLSEKAAQLDE